MDKNVGGISPNNINNYYNQDYNRDNIDTVASATFNGHKTTQSDAIDLGYLNFSNGAISTRSRLPKNSSYADKQQQFNDSATAAGTKLSTRNLDCYPNRLKDIRYSNEFNDYSSYNTSHHI